ncbi:MAG: protein kinase [Xanthomonadales bacterium]|nr:protein kinase [Xanthomonadales bacterium]
MATDRGFTLPLTARLFLVISILVMLSVGAAVYLTWRVGDRLGQQAVAEELAASATAQRRFETLEAEKLELIAQSIATDPFVANYLEQAIGGDLGLDQNPVLPPPSDDDELGMAPVDELGTASSDELGLGEPVVQPEGADAEIVDDMDSDESELAAPAPSVIDAGGGVQVAGGGERDSGIGRVSVRDLLEERRATQNFALAMVLDPNGALVARTGETEAFERNFGEDVFLGPVVRDLESVIGYWQEGGALYHAAATPIAKDGILVGFLLVASEVDRALSEQIQQISGAHVAFWGGGDQGIRLLSSSLPAAQEKALGEAIASRRSEIANALTQGQGIDRIDLNIDGERFSAALKPLLPQPGTAAVGGAMALTSTDAAMSSFLELRRNMLWAGLGAIVTALALSWWLGRRTLRPVASMVQAAELAASGDYQHNIPVRTSDELGRLGRAFNSLLSNLREKSDIEGYVANLSRFLPDPATEEAVAIPKAKSAARDALLLLGIDAPEFVKAMPAGQENAMLTRLGSRLAQLETLAEARQGELLVQEGRHVVLAFRGERKLLQALHALRALLAEAARQVPSERPAFALAEGEVVHAGLPNRPAVSVALGAAVAAIGRLLLDGAPGRTLITPQLGPAVKALLGDKALAVAAGSVSGKNFYAIRPDSLNRIPAIAEAADANATRIVGGEDAPAASASQAISGQTRLAQGSLFASRYEILSVLGSGGMGVVYKARDRELDDFVALKMLRPGALLDGEQLDRLKSEIKLARKITHPNVLRTFDFGEHGGYPFISMEYVRGMTLRYLLEQTAQVPFSAGLRIARQLCAGLEAAHAVGVLHRDIKPENLILEQSGNAKLMDFGIARPIQRNAPGHTQPGMFVGTPAYSAPEQLQGEELDARSDIYSVGIMLCEMFCGRLPFAAGSTMEIYMAHLQMDPVKPSELWPDIPKPLEQVILKCLAKRPDDRFDSAAELMAALAELRA